MSTVLNAQPVITAISPWSGSAGSIVTIQGSGFSAVDTGNIVYWGSVRATVTSASAVSLTVTVPAGFNTLPVSVSVGGLTAYAGLPYTVTFAGGGQFSAGSFTDLYNFSATGSAYGIKSGDIDGDKKPDMVTINTTGNSFIVYKNTAVNGGMGFASGVNFFTVNRIASIALSDIDADGKPDIVTGDRNLANIYVYKNISTPGNIQFAAGIGFVVPENPVQITIADIDGDATPDLIAAGATSLMILRNTSSSGTLLFDPAVTVSGNNIVETADLDGDLKPELITKTDQNISIVPNNSSPGNILLGSVVSLPFTGNVLSLKAALIDNDNKLDIVSYNTESSNSGVWIFRNITTGGNIVFDTAFVIQNSGFTAADMKIADLNGDGKPDVLCSNPGNTSFSVYRNITVVAFAFDAKVTYNAITDANQLEIADFNCDGKPDISTLGAFNSRIALLRNNTGVSEVTSFSPQFGGEGTIVTITGTNLSTTTAVSFGGISSSSFSVISDNEVAAIVGAAGATGNVSLTTVSGIVSIPGFTFKLRPEILSLHPITGPVGQKVRITGNNFNSITSSNTVYFGAAKAQVIAAATSYIDVIVPAGATYQPVSVSTNGFTVLSDQIFTVTFTGGYIEDTVFLRKYSPVVNYNGANNIAVADLDEDGRNDLLVNIHGSILGGALNDSFGIYRNTSANGSVSFAPCIDFKTTGGFTSNINFADFDGDSKLDVIAINEAFPQNGSVNVFRNTSTIGNISFADPVVLVNRGATNFVSLADIDGDGKTDFAIADSYNEVSVYKNTSTGTLISFALPKRYETQGTAGAGASWLADIDGDGKPELLAASCLSNSFSIFPNTSTPGIINFATRLDININHLSSYITTADIDMDGKPDILLTAGYSRFYGVRDSMLVILRNLSSPGNFLFAQPYFIAATDPHNISVCDLDGNGLPDLTTVAASTSKILVFPNISSHGIIAFGPGKQYRTGTSDNQCAVTGDLDGDGKPDIVVTDDQSAVFSVFINQNSSDRFFCKGGSSILYANSTGSNYQWQLNSGNGFVNIQDNVNYSGTATPVLTITGMQSDWYGYQYRCLIDAVAGRITTTKSNNQWTGTIDNTWENPGNWSCGVVPDMYTDVVVNTGTIILNSNVTVRSLNLGIAVTFTINGINILTLTH